MILTKRIYDPASKEDGLRVLVMRLWPRGIKKNHIDVWYKELGTELELIKTWKSGKINWAEFKKKYVTYIRQKQYKVLIQELAKRARRETITLFCSCEDETHCHRTLLKAEIEKYI